MVVTQTVNIEMTTIEKTDQRLQKSALINLKLWTELTATTRKTVRKNLIVIFQKVNFASLSAATAHRGLQLPESFMIPTKIQRRRSTRMAKKTVTMLTIEYVC